LASALGASFRVSACTADVSDEGFAVSFGSSTWDDMTTGSALTVSVKIIPSFLILYYLLKAIMNLKNESLLTSHYSIVLALSTVSLLVSSPEPKNQPKIQSTKLPRNSISFSS
jgi:hypothetical protein